MTPLHGVRGAEGIGSPRTNRGECLPHRTASGRVRLQTCPRACTLLTDCMHGSVLTDEGCAHGIVPSGSPNTATDAFFEGACAGPHIDFDSKRRATFTGRLRLRSERGRTTIILEVESAKDIKITPAGSRQGKLSTDSTSAASDNSPRCRASSWRSWATARSASP